MPPHSGTPVRPPAQEELPQLTPPPMRLPVLLKSQVDNQNIFLYLVDARNVQGLDGSAAVDAKIRETAVKAGADEPRTLVNLADLSTIPTAGVARIVTDINNFDNGENVVVVNAAMVKSLPAQGIAPHEISHLTNGDLSPENIKALAEAILNNDVAT